MLVVFLTFIPCKLDKCTMLSKVRNFDIISRCGEDKYLILSKWRKWRELSHLVMASVQSTFQQQNWRRNHIICNSLCRNQVFTKAANFVKKTTYVFWLGLLLHYPVIFLSSSILLLHFVVWINKLPPCVVSIITSKFIVSWTSCTNLVIAQVNDPGCGVVW